MLGQWPIYLLDLCYCLYCLPLIYSPVCLIVFLAILARNGSIDLFYFDPSYAVVACLLCQYAVIPSTIASYLRAYYKDEVTREQIQYCVKYYAAKLIQSAAVIQKLVILRQTPPINYLFLYSNKVACRLCLGV